MTPVHWGSTKLQGVVLLVREVSEAHQQLRCALPVAAADREIHVPTLAINSRMANVVDPNYTIVAKAPKKYLPRDIPWMHEAHERMRRIGRATMAARPSG